MINDLLNHLLNHLGKNRFSPLNDNPKNLPDGPGVYIICTPSLECLPIQMGPLKYNILNGHYVIYVGIAGRPTSKKKSIRTRDYKNHFDGHARGSTLRKSLGVLFDLRKRQTLNEEGSTKFRFVQQDEAKLSNWMKENLLLYFFEMENPIEVEQQLIDYFNPPLNIKDNANPVNIDFRKELSGLRRLQ